MSQEISMRRRSLLTAAPVVALGTLVALQKPSWARPISPAPNDNIDDAIAALLSGPDAATIQQLTIQLITDPAVPALAASVLQSSAASLTGFQASYLNAIAIMTSDPDLLAAVASGTNLTGPQRASLEQIKGQLLDNPAMHKVLSSAAMLRGKKNAVTLGNFILQGIANLSKGIQSPSPLGSPTLDAIAADIAAFRQSPAYANLSAGLVSLMANPAFSTFLKHQRTALLAGIIPPNVVLGFLLPADTDPGLSDTTRGIIEVLMAVGGAILAIVTLPEELLTLPIIALIFLLYEGGLILGFDDIFKGIDCDFDGDPNDPNDVPGIECP